MESCLYAGRVEHRRHGAAAHAFGYELGMLYVDLDELPEVLDPFMLWSARRPAVAWFRRADHLGDPREPLADSVRALVARELGARPQGPVRLLTHLRYFGYCFNPLSMYYCFAPDGRAIEAVVAEVSNTPWGERHCYVLPVADAQRVGPVIRASQRKTFHVSPFLPMDMRYDWRLSPPGARLFVHIDVCDDSSRVMDAVLSLEREPLCASSLRRFLRRYPLVTLKVVAAIHFEAWRLWRRGATVFAHPDKLKHKLRTR